MPSPHVEHTGKTESQTTPAEAVCAVMVTYGQRAAFLEQAVAATRRAGVSLFVIVGNGIDQAYQARIEELAKQPDITIRLVTLPRNKGSATGFAAGIEAAMQIPETAFIWLLDDDNAPQPDALAVLLDRHAELSRNFGPDRLALASLRMDRSIYLRIARGEPPEWLFPRPGSVVDFDIRRSLMRLFGRLCRNRDAAESASVDSAFLDRPTTIPFAPYGGVFMPRALVEDIGTPDTRFVLYGDDTEYTLRIPQVGGRLLLVAGSRIEDLEASWHESNRSSRVFERVLMAESELRTFYTYRNGTYLVTREDRSHLMFAINRWLFLFLLWVFARRLRRLSRYHLIKTALRDGMNGRLGEKPGLRLP